MAEELCVDDLRERARLLRKHIIEMTTTAGSGHPSSSMSIAEIVTALYFGGIMNHDPNNPQWADRDRFILSKGHGCPALYAALAEAGYFPVDDLQTLRKLGSPLEAHPNMRRLPGIEASSGSLGQGLSIACGMAAAARVDGKHYQVYCVIGDGESNEGQIWEAAAAAAHFKFDNLTCIVDHNGAQQTGYVRDILDMTPLAEKWRAFHWNTLEIDGHDMDRVLEALNAGKSHQGGPTAIVARTKKGKGVSFMEADYRYHGKALTEDEAELALQELGWK